jgi:hypothetical protein
MGETHLSCVVLPLLATIGFILFVAEQRGSSYAEALQRAGEKMTLAVPGDVQILARKRSAGEHKTRRRLWYRRKSAGGEEAQQRMVDE